ncbi:signal peptidase I [Cohnella nanjingensis]|uniref:Signal peptidase I n=1 Tax=Cohnella nanjingensis TaxID=1387779 RepID=A0A7X0RUC6_9BACL|nr:signal peptidase I [Cohnella nanjingensis]MBB6673844.1 signal peptidase I [Cohnella nanjingensis]
MAMRKPTAQPFPSVRLTAVCAVLLLGVLWWMWLGPASGSPPPIRDTHTPLKLAQVEPRPGLLPAAHFDDNMWGLQSSYSSDLVGPLVIHPMTYPDRVPQRGDVVYFSLPETVRSSPEAQAGLPDAEIARVIALPGETVRIKDGQIYIDGRQLDAFYGRLRIGGQTEREYFRTINRPGTGECGEACQRTAKSIFHMNAAERKIPEDAYFVLGDTAMRGNDSLVFGPLAADRVIGRVVGSTGKADGAQR